MNDASEEITDAVAATTPYGTTFQSVYTRYRTKESGHAKAAAALNTALSGTRKDRLPMAENLLTTIGENWDHFLEVDMAPNAPAVQRSEMHRSFYAGASSVNMILTKAHNRGDFDDEVIRLLRECHEYLKAAQDARDHDGPATDAD